MSDFFNYSYPVALKDHKCEWCGEPIPKGENYLNGIGIWEGSFENWRMHKECYEIGMLNDEITEGFAPFKNERPKPVARKSTI